jgi:hypothetical protein
MLHVTCDHCGKQLRTGDEHYVVKIEVFAAHNPAEITEEDLEEDHMEAVSQLLREMEESDDDGDAVEPTLRHFRYDLCPACRLKYLRDPLSKESTQKFDFSEN